MADADSADLSAFEFPIACEWEECPEPAEIMTKGCADERYYSFCTFHHGWLRGFFDAIPPNVCLGCRQPLVVFEHHFDTQAI